VTTYDTVLEVLHDPTRREIFERVASKPYSVGELAEVVLVSRPAVSQHLKALTEAGLVQHTKEGTRHIYRASPEGLRPLQVYLEKVWQDALADRKRVAEKKPRRGGKR
jgi:DNA-binding transcriptional ArsR family regulator